MFKAAFAENARGVRRDSEGAVQLGSDAARQHAESRNAFGRAARLGEAATVYVAGADEVYGHASAEDAYSGGENGREAQERWPTRSGGLRICGNPIRDVSHASYFRSALRCILPP